MLKGHYDRSNTKKKTSIPTIEDFLKEVPKEGAAILFCEKNGIIPPIKSHKCHKCGNAGARTKESKHPKSAKCNNKKCNASFSRFRGTFFDRA